MAIKIRRRAGRPSALQKFIEDALYFVALDLIAWQQNNSRVASGKSQNWRIETNRFGNNEPQDIAGQLVGVRYVNFALFGRDAGKRPRVSQIMRWMRQRGISARDVKSGQFKNNRSAAHAIATDIGKYGTKALRLSEALQSAMIDRSVTDSAEEHLPQMAEDSANYLIQQFEDSLGDLKNVIVTT